MVPRQLRGDETWCQGFSEPGTGSNLGSLSCRATPTDDGWSVTGQKVWTSLAQYSERCVLLTRTGTPESAHRGITAFFVDMDTPGITVRPIETLHGVAEFCEVFFDDVVVPAERLLGEVGGGWSVAMDLLPYERSTALGLRGAHLHHRMGQLLAEVPERRAEPRPRWATSSCSSTPSGPGPVPPSTGSTGATSSAPRPRSTRCSWPPPSRPSSAWPPTASPTRCSSATTPTAERWRTEVLYSRAATIYGGSAEIQRNIIAKRLLDLGTDR